MQKSNFECFRLKTKYKWAYRNTDIIHICEMWLNIHNELSSFIVKKITSQLLFSALSPFSTHLILNWSTLLYSHQSVSLCLTQAHIQQ